MLIGSAVLCQIALNLARPLISYKVFPALGRPISFARWCGQRGAGRRAPVLHDCRSVRHRTICSAQQDGCSLRLVHRGILPRPARRSAGCRSGHGSCRKRSSRHPAHGRQRRIDTRRGNIGPGHPGRFRGINEATCQRSKNRSSSSEGPGLEVLATLPWLFGNPVLAAILLAIIGFFLGLGQPITMTLITQAVPPDARGAALALRLLANRLGQVALPIGAGLLAAPAGPGGALWMSSAVLCVASIRWPRKH